MITVPASLRPLKGFIARLMRRADKANLGMTAAAVAFFGFLAAFPALAAVITIWGFAADPAVVRGEMLLLQDVLPAEAHALLLAQVEGLLGAGQVTLGSASLLSLGFALWSARSGVSALIAGINTIHHWPTRRGLHDVRLSVLLTLAMVAIALAALLASVVVPLVIAHLPLGTTAALALEVANILLALMLVVLALALAYRFGPNRPAHLNPPLFTWGLLVALLLWAIVSRGFVLFLANFNSYNQIYGSIGAVAMLLMWLYLSAYALLLGAAVDAELAGEVV
jgi:membrane protein